VRRGVATLALLAASCGAPQAKAGSEPDWSAVKAELARRVEVDQALRREAMATDPISKELVDKVVAADAENTAWLKDIVQSHGWPTRARVGDEGAANAWLLVQHADRDVEFQELCLVFLRAAAKQGQADPKNMAYLADRVAVNRNRPQRYGTQFVEKDGRFEPYQLEDPKRVDAWRAEVGLGTLAEYAEQLRKEYAVGEGKP